MAQKHRNILLVGVGAAIVGGLLFVTLRPEPVPVDLYTLKRDTFRITVDVDGETRVADLYEVAAPISGTALRSPVDVGDVVSGGETVVAQVEPASPGLLDARTRLQAEAHVREMEAALAVSETERIKAEEDLAYARTQYERVARLVDRNVSSLTQLEDVHQKRAIAEAALEAAKARISQVSGALDAARAALVDTTTGAAVAVCCVPIVAPADGVVLEVEAMSARPVVTGTRLLSIGDPRDMEIVADILSSDAVRLPPAAEASVERWGGPPLRARLKQIEPAARTKVSALGIEEQRVDAVFDLVSPFEERAPIGHGFAVFLRIVEYEEPDALLIPLNSAFRLGDGWAVFRALDGHVERVPVQLGRRNGRHTVVLSGLEVGDRVVEHPSKNLIEGAPFVERAEFGDE